MPNYDGRFSCPTVKPECQIIDTDLLRKIITAIHFTGVQEGYFNSSRLTNILAQNVI